MTMGATAIPRPTWRRYAPILAIAAVLALFFGLGLNRLLSLDMLVEKHNALRALAAAHPLAAPLLFVVAYALLVAISAPGATVLTVAAGALFGWAPGAIFSAVGATLGACGLFLAARSSFGAMLAARAGPAIGRLRDGFCDHATSYLMFLRLSPLFPFWFVNLAAALAGVRFRTFLWTTAVGILPASIVFAGAGASLDRITAAALSTRAACRAAGGADCPLEIPWSAIVTPQTFGLLIALSLAALATVFAKKLRARAGETAE